MSLFSCPGCRASMGWAFGNLHRKLAVIVVHNIADLLVHCHVVTVSG